MGKFLRILCLFWVMSITPMTIIGPITIKPSKKYGLIKLRNKIAATNTKDDVMKICLALIFWYFGTLPAFFVLNKV